MGRTMRCVGLSGVIVAVMLVPSLATPGLVSAGTGYGGSVTLDKNFYVLGNTMTVSVSAWMDYDVVEGVFYVYLKNPSGTAVVTKSFYAEENSFSFSYALTATSPTGTWKCEMKFVNLANLKIYLVSTDTAVVLVPDIDTDGDGLLNSVEVGIGTNPTLADTDGDTWRDGDELNKYYTDPLKKDTDQDGVDDNLDYDPLKNLEVTVTISEILALDGLDGDTADFFWKVTIGSSTSTSTRTYSNSNHIYPNWVFRTGVPDTNQIVSIIIELWDYDGSTATDDVCDISRDLGGGVETSLDGSNVELSYNLATGSWANDDYLGDMSGYRHLSGNEDGGTASSEYDCEMWFSVTQSDYDGDGLVYREEVNTYLTHPKVSNVGRDSDQDGLPIEWEDASGLSDSNPLDAASDRDLDQLTSQEEYTWRFYGTRIDFPDVLVEIDFVSEISSHTGVFDYIEGYYNNRATPQGYVGIHMVLLPDDTDISLDYLGDDKILEHSLEDDNSEFGRIKSDFFTGGRTGAWHYCLYVGTIDRAEPEDGLPWGIGEPSGWDFAIAVGEINAGSIWYPTECEIQVVMHEIGHNLDIFVRLPDGEEDYCDDDDCCMGYVDTLNPAGAYCTFCWAQLLLNT